MPRILALVVVQLLAAPPVAIGQYCCTGRQAKPKKSREARAKAKLERIKPFINAGKYKTARRRFRKLIRDYPGTVAALQAHIIILCTFRSKVPYCCKPRHQSCPGMNHCAGGAGTDTFDKMGTIEAWVASGHAPTRIVASHQTLGKVDRTRPLCRFPQVAKWNGSGSTDEAANFSCVNP